MNYKKAWGSLQAFFMPKAWFILFFSPPPKKNYSPFSGGESVEVRVRCQEASQQLSLS